MDAGETSRSGAGAEEQGDRWIDFGRSMAEFLATAPTALQHLYPKNIGIEDKAHTLQMWLRPIQNTKQWHGRRLRVRRRYLNERIWVART